MRATLLLGLILGMLPVAGCDAVLGVQDHKLGAPADSGFDSSSFAGTDDGGDGASPQTSDSGGADASACSPPCSGSAPVCLAGLCVACMPDSLQCNGNTPQRCSSSGAWQDQAPCGPDNPVCSGGVCAKFRLSGGVRSMGGASIDAGLKLVAQGFEIGRQSCNDAGLCVTGGVVP